MPAPLTVKVHPRAKFDRVRQTGPATFVVWTTQPAESQRANERVRSLLADHLDVPRRLLVISHGQTSRLKSFTMYE